MPIGRILLGLGLVVAGITVAALAGTARLPPAATPGEARAVNPSASDSLDLTANNTPSLARNPTDADNVVLSHRVDQPFGCGLHVSLDGGGSWRDTTLPQPPDTEPKCYAPDVAFGADGTLFVSYVMLRGRGNVPDSVWLVSSHDGGRSVSDPAAVTGPYAFQVRLVAHPTTPDHLAMTWLQAQQTGTFAFPETHNPVVMAQSTDGGRTWGDPRPVSAPDRARVLAPVPAFGEDGDLYVLHLDVLDDRLDYHGAHSGLGGPPYPGPWELVLARSPDGGRTWSESVVADDLVPIERYLVFLPPSPSLAVDGERLFAGFHDARLGDPDVWLWASADGGASWDPPVRVNDTPEEDGSFQYLPAVAATPGGRIDVLYYDRREDPDDIANEVSLQSSVDGGQTFSDRVHVSGVAFDSRIGFGAGRGMPDLGSRLALLAAHDTALAAWADTRNAVLDSGKQDVYLTEIDFRARTAPRTWVRAGGAASALVGLVVGAVALRGAFARKRVIRRGGRGARRGRMRR